MEKINRCKRASEYQKDYLVNYLENNEDIANDKCTTADGARLRDSKWKQLADELNNLGGPQKPGDKWRKYWRDLRLNTKAKYSALQEAKKQNGENGFRRTKPLSLLEEKIIHITTDKADVGDNTPEVGFGDGTFLIYDVCGAASTDFVFEEVKCEISEAETTTTDDVAASVLETTTLETTTTAATVTTDATVPATTKPEISKAAAKHSLMAKRARRETQESKEQVGKLFTVEQRKLKAMEVANDLKKEQLKLMKEQTEAIRADTEMKRYFYTKLEEAIVTLRGKT